ncbi:sensor histidine kinase [Rhodobacter capsulatus]
MLDDLTRRVERLLQLSRSEAGLGLGRGPSDLVQVARLLVEEARRQGAEVRFDDGDVESLSLPVDADALAILIRNLLENALEHGTGPVRVVISLAGDGGGAALMIENPTAQTAFVEAPFAKGPGSRGLGLGLSIVAALAAAMGASVDKTIRAGRARVVVRF